MSEIKKLVEAEDTEKQLRGLRNVSKAGVFLVVILLGVGTQQEVIRVTAAKMAEVTQLEARAAAAKAVQERLSAVKAELELANSQLASVKDAVLAEEEKLAEVKTPVTTVPVVAEPAGTTTTLVARMRGWLK